MSQGHNFNKFVSSILKLSIAEQWLEAKPEWELHSVYHDSSERACECGHHPINQICIIKNRDNGNETEVGNVCIHNFMQLASRRIFAVIRRVNAELTKSLNPAALDLFSRRGAISPSEAEDYKLGTPNNPGVIRLKVIHSPDQGGGACVRRVCSGCRIS